jgi:hypothetical protein
MRSSLAEVAVRTRADDDLLLHETPSLSTLTTIELLNCCLQRGVYGSHDELWITADDYAIVLRDDNAAKAAAATAAADANDVRLEYEKEAEATMAAASAEAAAAAAVAETEAVAATSNTHDVDDASPTDDEMACLDRMARLRIHLIARLEDWLLLSPQLMAAPPPPPRLPVPPSFGKDEEDVAAQLDQPPDDPSSAALFLHAPAIKYGA